MAEYSCKWCGKEIDAGQPDGGVDERLCVRCAVSDAPSADERQLWYDAHGIASRTMPQLLIAGEPESLGGWDAIREMAPSAIGGLLE